MTDEIYDILQQSIMVQKADGSTYIFKVPDNNSVGQLKNTGDGTLAFEGDNENYTIKDEKPVGTDGGTFDNGVWVTRDLNTLNKYPTCSTNISLSNNEFTLQSGTYEITVNAPCNRVGEHQCRLYNVTTSSIEDTGTSSYADKNNNAALSISSFNCVTTISSATTYKIEHICSSTKTKFGLGLATGFGTEVYTTISIRKIS
jgi:hypothetical protein